MSTLVALDYAAALIFALSGALAASRAQLDLVGFAFLASLTALGGGTVRDLLLDRNPVFWIADPTPLAIACGAAVVVFFTAHLLESRQTVLTWLDALALPIAVAAGVRAATEMEQSVPIVLLMGIATGCFGGLLRDIVANEVPLLIRPGKLYVTAALAGGGAALIAGALTDHTGVALAACICVTFALRAGSLAFGWRLPVYKPRAPRS
ncbi:trimeric intracellular cation channel family protein [Roseibacterium sp. SDUM158016]|uniref:trimeric intracellular cation channel family protein n=1 Tax=Roseicyclus sediminis TaxID=2980997 RepID=UPI0021D370DC|nr:trimeric intracellular cation channel family protein [Roseibacterium sp. SDUM158016]MCU4652560.1 trimeric intracellular cation channel family protein [Roseibacterium sp. SDUM158016]